MITSNELATKRDSGTAVSTAAVPRNGRQIISTASPDVLEIALVDVPVVAPKSDQVVVRIEAAPINPSDLIILLGAAAGNLAEARFGGTPQRPCVQIPLGSGARQAMARRIGLPLPVGQEGAGHVVSAGSDVAHLLGQNVAVQSPRAGLFAEYQTVAAADCVVLAPTTTPEQAASMFVNPLTALAMVETLHLDGAEALIHTAAASQLGQMLVKICAEDGVPLVNVVRSAEQVDLLRGLGARYVCDSSRTTFGEDLLAAVTATGATVAFEAIGGGAIAGELLSAMEAAAVARSRHPSPFGSFQRKHVYVYGHLDDSPTVLQHGDFGLLWGVSGWLMPTILDRIGPQRAASLRERIISHLDTTFHTSYAARITLAEALHQDVMTRYTAQSTAGKYLITAPDRPVVAE